MTTLSLQSGVHLINRRDGFIQIGIHPESSVLVPESAAPLLALLTGRHSRNEIIRQLSTEHFNNHEVNTLLDLLVTNNLVRVIADSSLRESVGDVHRINNVRANTSSSLTSDQRLTTEVSIYGAGRLGTLVALMLSSHGFARLRVFDSRPVTLADVSSWGASRVDVGLRRDQVVATILTRMHKDISLRSLHTTTESSHRIAIICPDQPAEWPWFDPSSADHFMSAGVPHLLAGATSTCAAISSVITPEDSSCLRCHYHALTDRDPQWPIVSLQLSNRPTQDLAPTPLLMSTALEVVSRVELWSTTEVGRESSWTYVRWPGLGREEKAWGFHPGCGCQWSSQLAA